MEWTAEGLTLCFLGLLVLVVTFLGSPGSFTAHVVYVASAGMLVAMAVLSALTGAKTSIVPMKLCPFVKSVCAVLVVLGRLI